MANIVGDNYTLTDYFAATVQAYFSGQMSWNPTGVVWLALHTNLDSGDGKTPAELADPNPKVNKIGYQRMLLPMLDTDDSALGGPFGSIAFNESTLFPMALSDWAEIAQYGIWDGPGIAVSLHGTVNISGTLLTLVSGDPFVSDVSLIGFPIALHLALGTTIFQIASVAPGQSLTVTQAPGDQDAVGYEIVLSAGNLWMFSALDNSPQKAHQPLLSGTVAITGSTLTLVTGGSFQASAWPANYLVGKQITLLLNGNAAPFTVLSVESDGSALTVGAPPGDSAGIPFSFVPPEANPTGVPSSTAATSFTVPAGRRLPLPRRTIQVDITIPQEVVTGICDIAGDVLTLVSGGPFVSPTYQGIGAPPYLIGKPVTLTLNGQINSFIVTAVGTDTATVAAPPGDAHNVPFSFLLARNGNIQEAISNWLFRNLCHTAPVPGPVTPTPQFFFGPFAPSLELPAQLGEGRGTYLMQGFALDGWGGQGPWQFGERLLSFAVTQPEIWAFDPNFDVRTVLIGSDDGGLSWSQIPTVAPVGPDAAQLIGTVDWALSGAILHVAEGLLLAVVWKTFGGVRPTYQPRGIGYDAPRLNLYAFDPFSGEATPIVIEDNVSPYLWSLEDDRAFPMVTPNGWYSVYFNDNGALNNTDGNTGTWAVAKTSAAETQVWDVLDPTNPQDQMQDLMHISSGNSSAVGIAADLDSVCYYFYFRDGEFVCFTSWNLTPAGPVPETILSDWWPDKTKPQPQFTGKVFYVRQNEQEEFAVLYDYPDWQGQQPGTATVLGLRVSYILITVVNGVKVAESIEQVVVPAIISGTVSAQGNVLTLLSGDGNFDESSWPANYLVGKTVWLQSGAGYTPFTITSVKPDSAHLRGTQATLSAAPGDGNYQFYFLNPDGVPWNPEGVFVGDIAWAISGHKLYAVWQRVADGAVMCAAIDYEGAQPWNIIGIVFVPGGRVTQLTCRAVGAGIGIVYMLDDATLVAPASPVYQMMYYYMGTLEMPASSSGAPAPAPSSAGNWFL